MSILSRRRSESPDTAGNPAAPFEHWEPSGSPYLTDGVNLYRYAGGVPHGTSQLVALEDCRSLKLLLFSHDELRAQGMRSVDSADGEPTAAARRRHPHADDGETPTR